MPSNDRTLADGFRRGDGPPARHRPPFLQRAGHGGTSRWRGCHWMAPPCTCYNLGTSMRMNRGCVIKITEVSPTSARRRGTGSQADTKVRAILPAGRCTAWSQPSHHHRTGPGGGMYRWSSCCGPACECVCAAALPQPRGWRRRSMGSGSPLTRVLPLC